MPPHERTDARNMATPRFDVIALHPQLYFTEHSASPIDCRNELLQQAKLFGNTRSQHPREETRSRWHHVRAAFKNYWENARISIKRIEGIRAANRKFKNGKRLQLNIYRDDSFVAS